MKSTRGRTLTTIAAIGQVFYDIRFFAGMFGAIAFAVAVQLMLKAAVPSLVATVGQSLATGGHAAPSWWHIYSVLALGLGFAFGLATRWDVAKPAAWMIPALPYHRVKAYEFYGLSFALLMFLFVPAALLSYGKLVLASFALFLFSAGVAAGLSAGVKKPYVPFAAFTLVVLWPAPVFYAAAVAPIPFAILSVAGAWWLFNLERSPARWRARIVAAQVEDYRIYHMMENMAESSRLRKLMSSVFGRRPKKKLRTWPHGPATRSVTWYLKAVSFERESRNVSSPFIFVLFIAIMTVVLVGMQYILRSDPGILIVVMLMGADFTRPEPRFIQLMARESLAAIRFWHTVRSSATRFISCFATIQLTIVILNALGRPLDDKRMPDDLVFAVACFSTIPLWDLGTLYFDKRRPAYGSIQIDFRRVLLAAPMVILVFAIYIPITRLTRPLGNLAALTVVVAVSLLIHRAYYLLLTKRYGSIDLVPAS